MIWLDIKTDIILSVLISYFKKKIENIFFIKNKIILLASNSLYRIWTFLNKKNFFSTKFELLWTNRFFFSTKCQFFWTKFFFFFSTKFELFEPKNNFFFQRISNFLNLKKIIYLNEISIFLNEIFFFFFNQIRTFWTKK